MSYTRHTLSKVAGTTEALGQAGWRGLTTPREWVATGHPCPLCSGGLSRPVPLPHGRVVQAPPGAQVGNAVTVDVLPDGYDAIVCRACKVWYYIPPEGA